MRPSVIVTISFALILTHTLFGYFCETFSEERKTCFNLHFLLLKFFIEFMTFNISDSEPEGKDVKKDMKCPIDRERDKKKQTGRLRSQVKKRL